MRYIVIGLGNFGSVLATRLTQMGHEVVGVDRRKGRVEELRDSLSTTICLDAGDPEALQTLPLADADRVIVSIAEDFSSSIHIVASLIQMGVKNLVARAFDEIHRNVLQALGIDRIIFPEKEAAEVMAQSLELSTFLSSYRIDRDHYVMRFELPAELAGRTASNCGLEKYPTLKLLTVLRDSEERNALGVKYNQKTARELTPDFALEAGDILVVYGTLKSYNDFTRNLREL